MHYKKLRYFSLALGLAALVYGCPSETQQSPCTSDFDCVNGEACVQDTCVKEKRYNETTDAGSTQAIDLDAGVTADMAWAISIIKPSNESGHFAAQSVYFEAVVAPPANHDSTIEDIQVQWRDDTDNELFTGHDNESGRSSFNVNLAPGHHRIHASILSLETQAETLASETVNLFVCENGELLDFTTELNDTQWYTHIGDGNDPDAEREIWHEDGYLELSNNVSEHTALVDISRQFNPGNLHLSFRMNMGRCAEPETSCLSQSTVADGFAISIFNLATSQELIDLIRNHTRPGGGLGYMLMNHIETDAPAPAVEAFHLQFDAYYNHTSIGHNHDDPTQNPHVQVHLNGNLTNDLDPNPDNEMSLWTEIPELVDNQWHEMAVSITGTRLQVMRDAEMLFEGTVPDYTFKGGFLVLTATTGAVGMYQRIDDLEFLGLCPYQESTGE